ncbi:MAG: acyl-CoA thioesterase II [Microbacteriaceae bacterium]|nr:acyl-CoA thioesterase II [Microbacteriaceae bacterium]
MDSQIKQLLEILDIQKVDGEGDNFVGINTPMFHGRIFGGQVLAQTVMAASRTVEEDRHIHSVHGYFLRPGDVKQPVNFSVDRIHEGRSFSTRRVQAFQQGVPIFSMIASFQTTDEGLDHQMEVDMSLFGDPEKLTPAEVILSGIDHPAAIFWATGRPFDMRHVGTSMYLTVEGEKVAHQAVWFKPTGELPNDRLIQTSALAYLSDYSLLETILRKHGIAWSDPRLKIASLDHAMWFHRPVKLDDWMIYVQESPSAQGGRGLALGRIYDRQGKLIASVAQEGMVRV